MAEVISYFNRYSGQVCFIGSEGAAAPEIMRGRLIFRRYYKDASRTQEDKARSNASVMDTVFRETDRLLREQQRLIDRGGCQVICRPLPQLSAEVPDGVLAVYTPLTSYSQPENRNAMLAARGIYADGLAVILAGRDAASCRCLSEEEAEKLLKDLQEDLALSGRKH